MVLSSCLIVPLFCGVTGVGSGMLSASSNSDERVLSCPHSLTTSEVKGSSSISLPFAKAFILYNRLFLSARALLFSFLRLLFVFLIVFALSLLRSLFLQKLSLSFVFPSFCCSFLMFHYFFSLYSSFFCLGLHCQHHLHFLK